MALAVFLYLFSAVLLLSGALQISHGPYRSFGTTVEWGALVALLGGLGILVWQGARTIVPRRTRPPGLPWR
jgi:hypothetical protein